MKLKETDIKIHDLAFLEAKRKFNIASESIGRMHERMLPEIETERFWRVKIYLHDILKNKNSLQKIDFAKLTSEERKEKIREGEYYYQNKIEDLYEVATIHRRFDFNLYFRQTDHAKKRMILDELHAGVLAVAEHFAWDRKPLEEAYQKCLDADLQNHWYAKKLGEKSSSDRKHKAAVWVEYDLAEIRLFLHLFDKQKQLIHSQLFYTLNGLDETTMYPDDIMPILHGKLTWQKNEVVVTDKKGNEIARIGVTQEQNV